MAKKSVRKAWSIEQRLEFIDFRLFWEGTIQRADLTKKFGVSIPQASLDLAKYRESAPDNLVYDARQKRYVGGGKFRPIFFEPNPARYLAQLRAINENVISINDTLMGTLPPCDSLPVPSREVSAFKLRRIIRAIRQQKSISIEYQSMSDKRPEPTWRDITPHALGSDGLRWHVRAYCHIESRFKDFIISRCLRVGKFGVPQSTAEMDIEWSSFFSVTLTPNPHFSKAQCRTIELDYGMKEGKCSVSVRHALLYYFNKRMRLDIAERQDRPKETPIVVQNRKEYDDLLCSIST